MDAGLFVFGLIRQIHDLCLHVDIHERGHGRERHDLYPRFERHANLRIALNRALRLRALSAHSSCVGRNGFFVRISAVPWAASARKLFFTIRSSSEWNAITHKRPPGFKAPQQASRPRSNDPISSLTTMRSAWNVRVAGWIFP